MLDHILMDAIGAMRDGLEDAHLDLLVPEEQFRSDVLLGHLMWKTAYGLPGETVPPRTRADVTFTWSTWSQAAYRSWFATSDYLEPPNIGIEIVFHICSGFDQQSELETVMAVLHDRSPDIGDKPLNQSKPTARTVYGTDLNPLEHAFEVAYEGVYELVDEQLADGGNLDSHFSVLGNWVASMLVKLDSLTLSKGTTV